MVAAQTKDTLAHNLADRLQRRIQSEQIGDGDFFMNEAKFAFNGLILQMTGSPLITGKQQVLTKFFKGVTQDASRLRRPDEITVWQHHEIVVAIRNRDVDRARSMMRLRYLSLLSSEEN